MKDFMDYFSIDWIRTGDNIRSQIYSMTGFSTNSIERSPVKTIAVALHKTERTVFSWLNGSRRPSVDDLLLLSKFFNVSIDALIAINGANNETSAQSLFEKYSEGNREPTNDEDELEREFAATVLLFEVLNNEYPIKTLEDLILYLPLFRRDDFDDILCRFQGSVYGNSKDYVREKLKYCYERIENLPAKGFADKERKYMSEEPTVYGVTEKTRDVARLDKFAEWKEECLCKTNLIRKCARGFKVSDYWDKENLAYLIALFEYASKPGYFGEEFYEEARECLSCDEACS
jgi:transcriptional regulator with XRE-family HTH domain